MVILVLVISEFLFCFICCRFKQKRKKKKKRFTRIVGTRLGDYPLLGRWPNGGKGGRRMTFVVLERRMNEGSGFGEQQQTHQGGNEAVSFMEAESR